MSQVELASRPASSSTWHMYRAMVGIGVFCGLIIVTVFQLTRPVIERNKAEALQKAIFHVLPQASTSTAYRLDESGAFDPLDRDLGGEQRVYAGYDGEHELLGFAVEAEGMGYQDVIRLIYGYSFAKQAIIGIQILESKETPGLGDKIQSDPDFLKNFQRLDVSLSEDRTRLAKPIVPVRHGQKTHPWEVDSITGATISSTAIADILNRSAQYWVPRIQNNLNEFEERE